MGTAGDKAIETPETIKQGQYAPGNQPDEEEEKRTTLNAIVKNKQIFSFFLSASFKLEI